MKRIQRLLVASVLVGLMWGGAANAAEPSKAEPPKTEASQAGGAKAASKAGAKDLFMSGDAKCTRCHDEADAPGLLAIGKTRHGTKADGRVPTCVTCHGESDAHVANSQNTKVRPPPDRTFSGQLPPGVQASEDRVDRYFGIKGKGTENLVEYRNAACTGCHQGGKHMNWNSSTHAQRDVACTNCHQVHVAHDKVRDKRTQPEVCFTCHKEQRAQINKTSHHPIPEGKMTCSDCHNVHGDNPKQLVKNSVNETCYTCHMEKRGPFVHNHQPVAEDCSICHNSHGSTNPGMLKRRAPFLCQECHSHASHPGQAAALPTVRGTGTGVMGTVGRACMNCHTNVHGGNSTVNSATSGRFRR